MNKRIHCVTLYTSIFYVQMCGRIDASVLIRTCNSDAVNAKTRNGIPPQKKCWFRLADQSEI